MRILEETSRALGEFLLVPNLTTEDCTPDRVDLSAPVAKHKVGETSALTIATPMVSAIMQAVSCPELAVALAQCGGLSFIHHNQSIDSQVDMVRRVKRHKAGFRYSERNVKPSTTLGELTGILGDPPNDVAMVTDDGNANGLFLGLISRRDYHPKRHMADESVSSRMQPADQLATGTPQMSLSDANSLIWESHQDVLPIVDGDGRLVSVVFRRDYELHKTFQNETIDAEKRFRVGAGINTHDYRDRLPALLDAGADVVCLDSSDGYSVWQKYAIEFMKHELASDVPIGAGNVVDGRAFRYLAEAGADFVKVGIGGGSICITRDQKGIGVGQASAIIDVVRERDAYAKETGFYIPICCDGGLLSEFHMAIALALGADFVMLGRYFARFDESASPLVRLNGQFFKEYWGEGSSRARNWQRYDQGGETMVFEEGVDGYVPYAGSLYDNVALSISKLRSTMVSCGATNLRDFHDTAILAPVSSMSYAQNSYEVALRDKPQTGGSGF